PSYILTHNLSLHDALPICSEQVTVFGADKDRLSNFTFVDTRMVQDYDFKNSKEKFDIIVEATGGEFSSSAINQAIEIIRPLGDLDRKSTRLNSSHVSISYA